MKGSYHYMIALTALTLGSGQVNAQGVGSDQVYQANLSASDYAKYSSEFNNYNMQSSRIAASKATREDVKGYAKQLLSDSSSDQKSLMAGLSNQDRKIAVPSERLSAENQSKIDLLRKAPKSGFDALYLQQQMDSQQAELSLQQGYAQSGADPTFKQIASVTVPNVQRAISTLGGLSR